MIRSPPHPLTGSSFSPTAGCTASFTIRRQFAALRLCGATVGQVLRAVAVEAFLVAAIGLALAAAITAVAVGAVRHALTGLAPSVRMVIPWLPIGAIALSCLVIATGASLIPAAVALRRRPLELAGGAE
jgi:putative ABC transport system permease protein